MSISRADVCGLGQVLAACALLLLSAGEHAYGATDASIGAEFHGIHATYYHWLARHDGGGGPHHIVELLNDAYSVYDKATGQLLQHEPG